MVSVDWKLPFASAVGVATGVGSKGTSRSVVAKILCVPVGTPTACMVITLPFFVIDVMRSDGCASNAPMSVPSLPLALAMAGKSIVRGIAA